MSEFDRRLHERLAALDAAVPPSRAGVDAATATSSTALGAPLVRRRSPLSAGLVAALVVVVAAVTVFGIALRPNGADQAGKPPAASATSSAASASATAVSRVVIGPDGVPTSIDGERVYGTGYEAAYAGVKGSFLIVVTGDALPHPMPACAMYINPDRPENAAESDLLGFGFCGAWPVVGTAPKSEPLLADWPNHRVVARAHTHDGEAAGCRDKFRPQCEDAVVLESLVWPPKPVLPSQIDGQPVLKGGLQAPARGTFLVGGMLTDRPAGFISCSEDTNAAYVQLQGMCQRTLFVGLLKLAPMSKVAAKDGMFVVARVHTDDPLAAQCATAARQYCEDAVVVDAIVWSADPYAR